VSSAATRWNPDSWAKVFHDAGAKYVMFDHEAPRRFYLVAQHYPKPDASRGSAARHAGSDGRFEQRRPEADGTIPAVQMSSLKALDSWLKLNGDAIYATQPWKRADGETGHGTKVRFTQ
jgi:alpha-L-fucosidase